MSALWLSAGGRPTEYISIERNDLIKIKEYFNRTTAETLQNEIIFSILYFLGARGREEFRRLRRRGTVLPYILIQKGKHLYK